MSTTGRFAAVGVTAVLALTLAGCSSSSKLTLHVEGGNVTPSKNHIGGELSLPLKIGKSDSELVGGLCTNAGPVEVTSVKLHKPTGGIHLDAWGIENGYSANGGGVPTLEALGNYSSRTVTQRCNGKPDHDAQVGVQVSRRGDESGYAEGFDLSYKDSAGSHTVWLDFGVKLRVSR